MSIPGDSEPPFRRHSTAVPLLAIPRFRESDTEVPVRWYRFLYNEFIRLAA